MTGKLMWFLGAGVLAVAVVTCVRESMYTTTFDAPPAGQNSVTVTYPFSFAP